jgi:hypothetical protein
MTTTQARTWPRRDAKGRTNQPVRRDSREAEAHEPQAFLSRRQQADRLAAFKQHARALRRPGRRWGSGWKPKTSWTDQAEAYGVHCAEVLAFLMYQARRDGRVFPSLEKIAEAVGCAYRTAVRCVQQLARGGWLSWERRFVRVGKPGKAEIQVVQTTNLYHLALPTADGRLIEAWTARRPPPPDDIDPDAARIWRSGEARAAEAEAAAQAFRAVERRNQHLISKLAAARTPRAVIAIFRDHDALGAALAKLDPSSRPSANSLEALKRS